MDITKLKLRKSIESDLEIFFKNQLDEESNQMAAFTAKDPSDKEAYMKKWKGIVVNPNVNMQTILIDNVIVGSVLHFSMDGKVDVSYWIGKEYWGQGIATQALRLFIKSVDTRPLYGRVAFDNHGSRRVLEKCGFKAIATERGFANARGKEIEETVLMIS